MVEDRQSFSHRSSRFLIWARNGITHYRTAFDSIAKLTIEVDAPGLTSPNYKLFDFKKVRRPIYPLDEMPLDAYPGDQSAGYPAG
jgi:microcystin degradation protein MlrC